MELTPEERQKIYEEEKARIEARERLERERQAPGKESTVDLQPNVAGLLCYVGWWISGLIFFIIEQKNEWIRFHAAQAIITFGSIVVVGSVINLIPWVGPPLAGITWFIGFVLWIVLMIKAYNGERFKLGIFGDFAEKLVASSGTPSSPTSDTEKPAGRTDEGVPTAPASVVIEEPYTVDSPEHIEQHIDRKVKEYFRKKQSGYIIGSAFAIAWSIILLVFLNFFNEYFAYYNLETINGREVWVHNSFFTSEIGQWLPILTTTLVLAIVGHIIIIVLYRPLLRKIITFVLDIFGLATVISLLVIYPFNFDVIPNDAAASIMAIAVTVVLIGISIGIAISLIVRLIQGFIALTKGTINQD